MRAITRARLRGAIAAAAVAVVTVAAGLAQARPGGGGSYQGGGGGGGGGGGFHSGGGGFSPAVGVPVGGSGGGGGLFFFVVLVLIIVFVVAKGAAQQRRVLASRAALGDESGANPAGGDPLAELRARDPALTLESIVDHVQRMADMLRSAWCAGDMGPARPFVSDGIFSRFQVQLGLMQGENRRNVMGDARVLGVSLVGAEIADPLDVVHVRVDAEARDTEVPWNATAEQIAHALQRAPVEPYSEIWSITRLTGAQSKAPGFEVGRACPGCGAPLAQGETMKCRYCGALVCSGEHDWVLAEITQMVEWQPGSRPAQGLDALRARDRGVAREALEDRASYVFWKWVQAGRAPTPQAPLAKCATAAFLGTGTHLEWVRGATDVAVGAADLVACEVDPSSKGFDYAFVQVAWSARLQGNHSHTSSRHVLRLARRTGVTSKPSLTALVCTRCGAPLVESESARCDHCGAELAAGDQAWVLDAITAP
jgi:hypothetical protein